MLRIKGIRLVLATASLALSGCSAIMAASTPAPKDMNVLLIGTPRSDVLKEFGEPAQTGAWEGKRVDTFKFKEGQRGNVKYGRAALHAGMDLITFGIWEVFATPAEIMGIQPDIVIDVTYDEVDRVEFVGPAGVYWIKAGLIKEDFQRDHHECRQISRPPAPPVGFGQPGPPLMVDRGEYQAENVYRDCMQGRGYELRRRQVEVRSQAAK
jgi:hypothetical protein